MARGFNEAADAIKTTSDGVDTRELWDAYVESVAVINKSRDDLVGMLSQKVAAPAVAVMQGSGGAPWERASEYGTPKGARTALEELFLGFDFAWYDIAERFTWEFLVEADSMQLDAIHNAVLEGDSENVFRKVMGRLLDPAEVTVTGGSAVSYGLYNGDGTIPPPYAGQTFNGTHTQYLVSGAAALDGQDLVDAAIAITQHGYADSPEKGRLLVFLNPAEAKLARGFRVTGGSPYDFIASEDAPTYLTDQTIVGDIPPARFGKIPLFGSFGNMWLSENPLIPAGYVVTVATGGTNSPFNVIGFREHARPELRGMRLVGGRDRDYPLMESFYQRGFGVGVRHRGAGSVMEVKATGAYAVPAAYVGWND